MAEQNDVLSCSIVESTVYKAINTLGFSSLKPQQMMAISAFIEWRDVFVVPLTGFGKTLCFTCLAMSYIPVQTISTLVSADDVKSAILTRGVIT